MILKHQLDSLYELDKTIKERQKFLLLKIQDILVEDLNLDKDDFSFNGLSLVYKYTYSIYLNIGEGTFNIGINGYDIDCYKYVPFDKLVDCFKKTINEKADPEKTLFNFEEKTPDYNTPFIQCTQPASIDGQPVEIDYGKNEEEIVLERVHVDSNIERALKNIIDFNKNRGLIDTGINVKRGAAFILEELMEMFEENLMPRDTALRVINNKKCYRTPKKDMTIILDSYADMIVYAVGEMAKTLKAIGNKDEDLYFMISYILRIITEANMKKSNDKDTEGKVIKGEEFTDPIIPLKREDIKC